MDIQTLLDRHSASQIYIKCQNTDEVCNLLIDIQEQTSLKWRGGEEPLEYYTEIKKHMKSKRDIDILNICIEEDRCLTGGYFRNYDGKLSYWYENGKGIELPSKQSLMEFLEE